MLMKALSRSSQLPEGYVVYTDYQSQGKGQGNNSWESAKGKNLLFSLLLRPHHIPIEEQFIISQIVSLGIIYVLHELTSPADRAFSIKWPNDIYWRDQKIGGILIENTLQGRIINTTVVGIGLNINQEEFHSNAPNPVSLKQITRKAFPLDMTLKSVVGSILRIYHEMTPEQIRNEYMSKLYRKSGYYFFSANEQTFSARIHDVASDGKLLLEDRDGVIREYYFKEVGYIT